jgi:drug/metabolite transporter (DMT)-like permease
MKTLRLPQHVARNVVHYAAQYGWFVALTLIPLAQVVALEFTMPIWSAALAVAFLGERMNRWKVLAVVLGLAGVAVIVRPAATGLNPGQLIALAAAVGFAVSVVLVKSLTRTDTASQVSFWMLVVQSVIGLVPALLVWHGRQPGVGLGGGRGVLRHVLALLLCPRDAACRRHGGGADGLPARAADRAVGWAVYAERVDLFTALGVALILGGNLLNLLRWPAGGWRIGRKA